jgi:hypothetical protein
VERLTKVVITLWACAAVAWQIAHLSWPTPLLAGVVACASALLTRLDRRAIGIVLVTAYIFPAIVRLIGIVPTYYVPFGILWIAALLGAIVPDAFRTQWHIPTRWRAALVFAAGAVAIGTTVVAWREVGGSWLLATDYANMWWVGTPPPPFIVSWVLHVGLILVVGVLWFDWLCGSAELDFERVIVTPLVIGAGMMSAVSLYQMFVDIRLFNETTFQPLRRAPGTMYDANVAGMLAALWVGGTFVWAERLRGRRVYVAPALMIVDAMAAWGSGSRTALIATACILASIVFTFVPRARLVRWRAWAGAAAAMAVLGGVLVLFLTTQMGTKNPVGRLWSSTPLSGKVSLRGFGAELVARNGYGTAAHMMIREFPISGIGVGSFHGFAWKYGQRFGATLPPDNAQNWLRHQIVELGVVGAAGWIVWFISFGFFVLRPHPGEPRVAWTARAIVGIFGVLSLMSGHGQELMVAMTFWVFAYWYAKLVGLPPASKRINPLVWGGMVAALAVMWVGSVTTAAGELALTSRALRDKLPLSYGFARAQPDGPDAGFHRARSRALAIVDATARWMAVGVKLGEDAVASSPIDVRVWQNGHVVLKATLSDTRVVTALVPVKVSDRLVLTTAARSKAGLFRRLVGDREAQVQVKWEFVDAVPPALKGYIGVAPASE